MWNRFDELGPLKVVLKYSYWFKKIGSCCGELGMKLLGLLFTTWLIRVDVGWGERWGDEWD